MHRGQDQAFTMVKFRGNVGDLPILVGLGYSEGVRFGEHAHTLLSRKRRDRLSPKEVGCLCVITRS